MNNDPGFWTSLAALMRENKIVIDRPRGKAHPRFPDFIFPVDYGYIEGTKAMDGGGIDVWRGTAGDERVTGIFCTIDGIKKDAEIKIAVACSREEIQSIQAFYDSSGSLKGTYIANPFLA